MKTYLSLIILLFHLAVESAAQSDIDSLIIEARTVSRQSTISYDNILKLVRFETEIRELSKKPFGSLDEELIFKRLSLLLLEKKNEEGYEGFLKSLHSGEIYALHLLMEFGKDQRPEYTEMKMSSNWRFGAEFGFGSGYSVDKNDKKRYSYRPFWHGDLYAATYPFSQRNGPSRMYVYLGATIASSLDSTAFVRYAGPKIGLGRTMRNLNSYSFTYEYLINFDGSNLFGGALNFKSNSFTFSFASYIGKDETLGIFSIKYDMADIFRQMRF